MMIPSLRLAGGLYAVLLTLATAAVPAGAAAASWTPLGPFGGTLHRLVVAPSDPRTVYASVSSSVNAEGLFRSTDGGLTWVPIHAGAVFGIAVDPSHPATVYASFDFGNPQKSTDGGGHWTPLPIRGVSGVTAIAVDPARPSRLYAGTSAQGVWHSLDGGATWQTARVQIPPGDARVIQSLALPKVGGIVYAGTDVGVFKSLDAAVTWQSASAGLPDGPDVLALAVAPSDPKRAYASIDGDDRAVYRTTNGGASWQRTSNPVGAGGPLDRTIALAVAPNAPATVWAGTSLTGLFRSTDSGAHWTSAGLPAQEITIPAIAIAPSAPRTLYAGAQVQSSDQGGVFASTDGGASWIRRLQGLAGLNDVALGIPPGSPAVLWAALSDAGLFRSANSGQRWIRVILPDGPSTGMFFRDFEIAPPSADTFYALGLSALWRSTDAGASWMRAFAQPDGPQLTFLRVDPADPFRLWGSIGFLPFGSLGIPLLLSTDGGDTWNSATTPNLGCVVSDLQFAPSAPSTLYEGGAKSASFNCQFTQASLFRSTDDGATWTEADAGLVNAGHSVTALAVDTVDSRIVYAATGHDHFPLDGDGVWKTTDGGATWAQAGAALKGLSIAAVAVSSLPDVVWAASGGSVFRSGDGGGTWVDRSAGLQAFAVNRLLIDPADPSRVYALTSSGVWVLEDAL
jgi:photosystem II stability/assembly factor-like uncharacterized protein